MKERDPAVVKAALRKASLFRDLSDAHFDEMWAQSRGTQAFLRAGQWLTREGDVARFVFILEGEIQLYKHIGDEEVPLIRYREGDFLGDVPLLLGTAFFASSRALTDIWLFTLDEAQFWEMLAGCPHTSRHVFRATASRLRALESIVQARERARSVATLAAGLAHELNNPASAARRAASGLARATVESQDSVCDLCGFDFSDAELEALEAKRREALDQASIAALLSPLTQSDLEEQCAEWLEAHGVDDAWPLSTHFVMAGLGVAWLESLHGRFGGPAFPAVVRWMEVNVRARLMDQELGRSLGRISDMVESVKAYSHLDQAPLQDVDLREAIGATLDVLAPRLAEVELTRDLAPGLVVPGNGPELSHMFTLLIENAIENGRGRVSVATHAVFDHAVVDVGDNGPGIPAEVQSHMFEPFFSTRGVGGGSGLGLVQVYRIAVARHGGSITYETGPQGTVFHVALPLMGSGRALDAMADELAGR
jgi:signal transduction histidine kinase